MTRGDSPVTWRGSSFLRGAVYALPAALVTPFDPTVGLALAVGVLPVAAVPLPARRGARGAILVVGAVAAIGFLIGGLLTQVPPLAVPAMFALALLCALWSGRSRWGGFALTLALPIVGIGLSFDEPATTVAFAVCLLGGSAYAWAVALLWPERPPQPAPPPPPGARDRWGYGILLGTAAAGAAALGYALDLEHVGWATGSALLVMRPDRDLLLQRSAGRAASVVVGAAAAAVLAAVAPPAALVGIAVALVLAALAATAGSRWYIAPGFTSFVVLTAILQGAGESPGARFTERVVETGIGIGLALLLGALVPMLRDRVRR